MSENLSIQIQNILNGNVIDDLNQAIKKRKCLNKANSVFIYIFHIIQTFGILTTTVAAGYNLKELVWVGAGLNALATLIHVFEKTNNGISKRLLVDIKAIKAGTYIDEGVLVEPEHQAPNDSTQQP